jgi:L-fucose mutarotase
MGGGLAPKVRPGENKMLIGIPSILGPELLATLRAMGHGDEIAIVDGNYPAQEHARRLVRADGHGVIALLRAILPLFPLDDDVPGPILRASLMNDPAQMGPIHHEIETLCGALKPGYAVIPLQGADLYPRIRAAHTILATSEMALYANVILRKGVVRAEDMG